MFLRRMEAQGVPVTLSYQELRGLPESEVEVWDWFTRGETRGRQNQRQGG